jgi:hypothetical protein
MLDVVIVAHFASPFAVPVWPFLSGVMNGRGGVFAVGEDNDLVKSNLMRSILEWASLIADGLKRTLEHLNGG